MEEGKTKKNVLKIIGNVVFWTVFAVLLVIAGIAFLNFTKVEKGEEASMYSSKEQYEEDGTNVTVYNYFLYKVVELNSNDQSSVSLKLWFLDDMNN